MAQRKTEIKVRLNEQEAAVLNRDVAKSGLSREAYLRALIMKKPVIERPPAEYFETLGELRQIHIDLNRIAVNADSAGFIDAKAYWNNVEHLQAAVGMLKSILHSEQKYNWTDE